MSQGNTTPSGFCARCYSAFMAEVSKKAGGNPNVFVDVKRMVCSCTIPRFTHDAYGHAIVILTDCGKKKEYTITLKEYQKRRREGTI